MASSHPPGGEGENGTLQSATSALLEFAAGAAKADDASGPQHISEELEGIVLDIARGGAATSYPWDALCHLLARKMERVLQEFWKDSPDVKMQDGETFEQSIIKPLMASILEPHRGGPPFTVQRLCELLVEPRRIYKSTRRFLYALQRALVVIATEDSLANMIPLDVNSHIVSGGLKRKLPDDLSNGVVSEATE